eukprot:6041640-Prymnesium_polylepis.1
MGEVHPLKISAERRGIRPNCSSTLTTIRTAITPKAEAIVVGFRRLNRALMTQLLALDSRISAELLCNDCRIFKPNLGFINNQISGLLSDSRNNLRKELKATATEKNAILRLDNAVKPIVSAIITLHTAASKILEAMDHKLEASFFFCRPFTKISENSGASIA